MFVPPNLNERQQYILWATIRHYIATAEPVGSKTLVEEYNLNISSATIRNALSSLEKAGLLYQPHTSAGRIPSDFGYRIYVNDLITPSQKLNHKIDEYLTQNLKKEAWSFEALLKTAAQILANISGYIALITLPQTATTQLKHLQLVSVSSKQVMLIIVTDTYQTQSVLMDFPQIKNSEEISEELQILSNFLNSKLTGRSLSELNKLNWTELDQEFKGYTDFLQKLLTHLKNFSQPTTSTSIMVRGVSEVLRQPEFSHSENIKMLFHLLEEEQDQLFPLIFDIPESKIKIKIGTENPLESMHSCSLVAANYHQDDIPVGSVGIIGPTRMLYENAIALVSKTADYLSETLA
jgi:heat-inducible transcriptional repressor